MKLKKNSRVRVAGLSSFFALLAVFGLAVFCPTSANTAEAASRNQRLKIDFVLRKSLESRKLTIDFFLENGEVNWQKVAQVLGIDFVIAKNISLGMANVGDVTIGSTQPTKEGVFVNGSTDFTVGTNSAAGLEVYVYNGNGTTGNSNMVGTVSGNVIPSLTSEVSGSGAAFAIDHWGYNLQAASTATNADTLKYKGVATSTGSNPDFKGAKNKSETLKLTFGAKVGYGTAPDTYKNTVNLHTVAAPETPTMINELMDEVEELKREAEAQKQQEAEKSGAEVSTVME